MEETNKNQKMVFSEEIEIRTMAKDIARLRRMESRGKEEILKPEKKAEEKPPIRRTVSSQPLQPPTPIPDGGRSPAEEIRPPDPNVLADKTIRRLPPR